MQLGLNVAVAIAFDNSRTEVSIAISRHNEPKVHEAADDDFEVLEDAANVTNRHLTVAGRLALINLQTRFDECTLVLSEPLGFFGEVGQQEEEEKGHDDSEQAFQDN